MPGAKRGADGAEASDVDRTVREVRRPDPLQDRLGGTPRVFVTVGRVGERQPPAGQQRNRAQAHQAQDLTP